MERIRYGVIGCGEHALQSHAIPNKDIAEFELAAVCDLSKQSTDHFAREVGGTILQFFGHEEQTAEKARQQFLRSNIGAVLISTPDEFHFDDLVATIQSGKHLL